MMNRNRNVGGGATTNRRQTAARSIQLAWIGYKNRQVFRLLKCTIAAAEHSLTQEILRKLVPREADFFRHEGFVQLKIRFRFGGCEFPPRIVYKIYVDSSLCKVKYVNGKKTLRAETEAAAQSAKLMGNRKYYDLMLQDNLMRLQHRVADEVDVITVKDFMHLLAVTDETQPEMGGKGNTWRQLTSQATPRYTVFRDVFDYLASRRLTDRLRRHLPLLTALPSSQEVRREQLRVLAEVEAPRLGPGDRPRLPKPSTSSSRSSRRSDRALSRAQKMREAYLVANGNGDNAVEVESELMRRRRVEEAGAATGPGLGMAAFAVDEDAAEEAAAAEEYWMARVGKDDGEEDEEEEDFEEEADRLYEWSKELTEGQLGSPRLA